MIVYFLIRINPDYMYYYIHWTRLLTTGIIPFSYLAYMNMRIYCRFIIISKALKATMLFFVRRRQNNNSTVRSRSATTKKAGNLAAILIVIGICIII